MMPANRSERGFLSISAIFGLALVGAVIFLAIKLLPPYITNYQVQDAMDNLARNSTYSPITEAELKKEVMKQARGFGVPLDDRQVTVEKATGSSVGIAIRYEVPVDLVARQVVLQFNVTAGNRNIVSR